MWQPFCVGFARCRTAFPVSVVVGAAVPAAVCRWGGGGGLMIGAPGSGSRQTPLLNRGVLGFVLVTIQGGSFFFLQKKKKNSHSHSSRVCGRTYVGAVGCLISWLLSRPCLVGSPRVDSPSISTSMYIVHSTHSICTHIALLPSVNRRCESRFSDTYLRKGKGPLKSLP